MHRGKQKRSKPTNIDWLIMTLIKIIPLSESYSFLQSTNPTYQLYIELIN